MVLDREIRWAISNRRGHCLSDFILQCKYILYRSVVPLSPDMVPSDGID